jgi:glycosyltransferase involved in cell wall biosynthesis
VEGEIEAAYSCFQVQRTRSEGEGEHYFKAEPQEWMNKVEALLPNARCEGQAFLRSYSPVSIPASVVPNGCNGDAFQRASASPFVEHFGLSDFVLCVGRIEPNKNQLSLIWALRDADLPIVLIGSESVSEYADVCRAISGSQVHFLGHLSSQLTASAMCAAAVHCLPSFGETPGLANLEAAAVGCPLVVSNRGAEGEYFGSGALLCDPLDPQSIRNSIIKSFGARGSDRVERLRERVSQEYSWNTIGGQVAKIYRKMIVKEVGS